MRNLWFREVKQLMQGHTDYKCLCDSKDHDLSVRTENQSVWTLVNFGEIIEHSSRERWGCIFLWIKQKLLVK